MKKFIKVLLCLVLILMLIPVLISGFLYFKYPIGEFSFETDKITLHSIAKNDTYEITDLEKIREIVNICEKGKFRHIFEFDPRVYFAYRFIDFNNGTIISMLLDKNYGNISYKKKHLLGCIYQKV